MERNMRNFTNLLSFLLVIAAQTLFAQNERWMTLEGANSNATPQSNSYNANHCDDVAVNDLNHDIYITGSMVFNSVFGSASYSPGAGKDGFIVRYNSAGSLIWCKQIPSDNLIMSSIAVDSS